MFTPPITPMPTPWRFQKTLDPYIFSQARLISSTGWPTSRSLKCSIESHDRMVAVLAVGDLAQSVLAVVAGDADQGHVLVLDHAAAVFVLDRRRKLVAQTEQFDIADRSCHEVSSFSSEIPVPRRRRGRSPAR